MQKRLMKIDNNHILSHKKGKRQDIISIKYIIFFIPENVHIYIHIHFEIEKYFAKQL